MTQIHSPFRAFLSAVTVLILRGFIPTTEMDKALHESTNISTLEASDVNMPEAGEKLEVNDNINDFEVDIEVLKSQLGLHELFSSMESMKSLISQVTATKRPASGPLVASLAK